jgi:hypothetical protein
MAGWCAAARRLLVVEAADLDGAGVFLADDVCGGVASSGWYLGRRGGGLGWISGIDYDG